MLLLFYRLKVEKAHDRIGLYICCGEEGRFPVSIDYQLMCRKRGTDDAVCSSVVFRTEFGKEKGTTTMIHNSIVILFLMTSMGSRQVYYVRITGERRRILQSGRQDYLWMYSVPRVCFTYLQK